MTEGGGGRVSVRVVCMYSTCLYVGSDACECRMSIHWCMMPVCRYVSVARMTVCLYVRMSVCLYDRHNPIQHANKNAYTLLNMRNQHVPHKQTWLGSGSGQRSRSSCKARSGPRASGGENYVCMHGWMDGWMDGWTDGRMDGWTDGRMDG